LEDPKGNIQAPVTGAGDVANLLGLDPGRHQAFTTAFGDLLEKIRKLESDLAKVTHDGDKTIIRSARPLPPSPEVAGRS
jgi:hypothetical protein